MKTKTYNGNRIVVIPDLVFDEIIAARNKYEKYKKLFGEFFEDNDFIICDELGHPCTRTYFTKKFRELQREIGLPEIHLHDLRHSYATFLKEAELINTEGDVDRLSLKAISSYMGHASSAYTDEVYVYHEPAPVDITYPLVLKRWSMIYSVPESIKDIVSVNLPESLISDMFPDSL